MKKRYYLFISTFVMGFYSNAQVDSLKNNKNEIELKDVVINKKKKAVEHLPDRTIYDFSDQPILNSGSMLQGLKKIPGLIASESVDLMYQGQSLDVYMDGRPLKISGTSLISFLEGLPANSVERIEIITNPGAEYAASSGGAIINIISSNKSINYTTLTYSGNYSFSDYDKNRNKTNNSLFLASKFKNINWKLNLGQSYKESMLDNKVSNILSINNDRIQNYNFIRPSFTYNLSKYKISLDYNFITNRTKNNVSTNLDNDKTDNKVSRNDVTATFQKVFDNRQKKLELRLNYLGLKNNFSQTNIDSYNFTKENNYQISIDYSTPINFLEKSKISLGGRIDNENLDIENEDSYIDFNRDTYALYSELQSKIGKLDLIFGLRTENYHHIGDYASNKISFNTTKIYPNLSAQYKIINSVFLTASYNKKIKFPSVNNLNPNNTIYGNNQISYEGNPFLKPTLSDNYSIKFSAFDYFTLSYSINKTKNDIFFLVEEQNNKVTYRYINAPDLTNNTFSLGIPLPLMVFTKGLDELMKFNFDINNMNILYFYVDYQKYKSDIIENQKGIWSFFLSGQFILPKDINIQAIYKITSKGAYKYYLIDKPFQNTLDINISRKFLKDNLSISIFGNDLLNSNKTVARTIPLSFGIKNFQKFDTRSFGVSFNYKIINSNKGEKLKDNGINDNIITNEEAITK